MKKTKVCPKCGGQDIVVIRGRDAQDRVRLPLDDYLWAERYLCCTCGYMESWVDAEAFVRKGGKAYWEKKEASEQDWDQMDAYWKEQLRKKREKEAQQERTEEKRKHRRDDPWT